MEYSPNLNFLFLAKFYLFIYLGRYGGAHQCTAWVPLQGVVQFKRLALHRGSIVPKGPNSYKATQRDASWRCGPRKGANESFTRGGQSLRDSHLEAWALIKPNLNPPAVLYVPSFRTMGPTPPPPLFCFFSLTFRKCPCLQNYLFIFLI